MYLQKIKMKGFKSFADNAEIVTGSGFTCIVGPNGCGKSNISDAVRWVLGEHNARNLRGDKMGDLIFSGSAKRPAEGMAEVSLVIDNSDRYFASEYTELEVTRRIFGSGETEYLINNNSVRLKDITELFMDTGIGTQTYSIMEQGRVEGILRARPIERRRIIEEAAGIVKYQTRKEGCVRKLKRVEGDLTRLNDILVEKERQVRYLKNQAGRARRFQEHSQHLKELDLIHIARRYVMLQEEAKRFKERLSEAQRKLADVNAKHTEAQARLEKAYLTEEEAETVLRKEQEAVILLASEIKNLQEKIQIFRDREKDIISQQERQHVAMDTDQRQAAEDSRQKQETLERLERIRREEVEARKRVEAAEEQFRGAQAALAQCQSQSDASRQEARKAENRLNECKNRLREMEREIERGHQQRDRLSQDLEKTRAEQQALVGRLSEMHSEQAELRERRNKLDEELTALRGMAAELSKKVDAAEEQRAGREEQYQMKKVRLASLRELHDNHEGMREGTVRLLKKKSEPNCPYTGILGALADDFNVRQGYEKAIETALGEALQHVLVEKGEEALRVMRDIVEERSGRVSLLALDLAGKVSDSSALPTELAGLSALQATELVEVPSTHQAICQSFLGHTLVVEDGQDLENRIGKIPPGWRIVTRSGILISGRGVISGGKGEGAGILKRQREMQELDASLQGLGKELEECRAALGALRRRRDENQERMATLVGEQHQLDVELASSSQQVGGMERDSKRLQDTTSKIIGELKQLESSCEQLAENQTNLRGELGRLEEELSISAQAVAAAELKYKEASETRDTLQSQFSSTRYSLVELTKDREQAERDVKRLSGEIERLENGMVRREEEKASLLERHKEIASELESQKESLFQFGEQKESADRVVAQRREDLENKKNERSKVNNECKELDKSKDSLQEEAFNHQRDFDQRDFEEQNLRARLEEEYQRSIDEVAAQFGADERDPDALAEEVEALRGKIERLGNINMAAVEDYATESESLEFMKTQYEDLVAARRSLLNTINEIKKTTEEIFQETFDKVRENFHHTFRKIFNGGKADMVLVMPPKRKPKPESGTQEGEAGNLEATKENGNGKTEEAVEPEEEKVDVMEAGIEIMAQPPGKNLQSISLMSGGERCLTAIALLFALYQIKPSPFCFLDEIDAPLDDVNIGRFTMMLKQFIPRTQFIIITHNKRTMEVSDRIYGVTMEQEGVSSLISMAFDSHNKHSEQQKAILDKMEKERTTADASAN
jgi:chromosome segregation protein